MANINANTTNNSSSKILLNLHNLLHLHNQALKGTMKRRRARLCRVVPACNADTSLARKKYLVIATVLVLYHTIYCKRGCASMQVCVADARLLGSSKTQRMFFGIKFKIQIRDCEFPKSLVGNHPITCLYSVLCTLYSVLCSTPFIHPFLTRGASVPEIAPECTTVAPKPEGVPEDVHPWYMPSTAECAHGKNAVGSLWYTPITAYVHPVLHPMYTLCT